MMTSDLADDYFANGYRLRAEMVQALRDYAEHGIPVGDFLRAAISNDFLECVVRADLDNAANLPALACYIYNEMPAGSVGSPGAYSDWIRLHQMRRAAAGVAADGAILAAGAYPKGGG